MSAQGLASRRSDPDLSVDAYSYFGASPSEIRNASAFGIVPSPGTDLYRVQYLYLLVFGNERSSTDYGGIQVRASTYLHLEEGAVPTKLQRVIQRCAHRGAYLFDSDLEESIYAAGGGEWGGGYLSGFTPVENGHAYRNWEVEPVGASQGDAPHTPGSIRWTTEVYLEVEGTQYADLSGVAQGIADPYELRETHQPGQTPVEAQQEWWQISETFNDARGAYQISAPARTAGRERAKNLRGKTVYVNGLPIGEVVKDGRVWLKKEYQGGMTYRGDHSRQSLVEQTPATPQALALGRPIAKVDESEHGVYLATAAVRPDSFDPVDPDEVDPDREVRIGVEGGTIRTLALADPDQATAQECRQDKEVIDHLGYSTPVYRHTYRDMWNWPGFRPIEEYGEIIRPGDDRDDGQTGVDEFGGGA